MMSNATMPIRTMRDVEAIESTPLAEQYSFQSTWEIFAQAARAWPDLPALRFLFEGRSEEAPVSFTYRELWEKINRTANLFHRLGIVPGEVVAYALPNLPQTHFTIWGGEAAGIVAAVNPLLEGVQIAEILNAVKARVLVTPAPAPGVELWRKIEPILATVPTLRTVLQVDLAQYLVPGYNHPAPAESRLGEIELLNFDRELAAEPGDRLVSGRVIGPDEIASYFHTGGTTGMPKIAPHTHGNEIFMAWVMGRNVDMRPGDVFLCGLPLFHVNAVMVTGLSNFISGSTVLLAGAQGYRSPKLLSNFWRVVERYRVNYFSGVPTIYAALLEVPVEGADLSSLRYGICGAAPMPPEIFRRFEQLTGVKILEGYGLTEGAAASTVNPPSGDRRIGSIGFRMPYQNVKIGILDTEGRLVREAERGEIGVVLIKGPNVFPGYLNPANNKKLWADDGWLNTGDLGRRDEDGYFWLTGRAKDLIIRGGHNIDPQAIEDVLSRHPAVALAAAIGQPDDYAGEVPMAYVTLRPGAEATPEEIVAFARQNIPERAATPVRIVILDNMPITAIGKIFKPQLQYRAIEYVLTGALAEAGIVSRVEAGPHPEFGTLAMVELKDTMQKAKAQKLLGKFSVRTVLV